MPFAVYVPTSFPDRLGELWWLVLEAVIARNDRIGLVIDGRDRKFDCRTVAEKRALYDELYWWLRALPTEAEMRDVVRNLAAFYHVDIAGVLQRIVHELGANSPSLRPIRWSPSARIPSPIRCWRSWPRTRCARKWI